MFFLPSKSAVDAFKAFLDFKNIINNDIFLRRIRFRIIHFSSQSATSRPAFSPSEYSLPIISSHIFRFHNDNGNQFGNKRIQEDFRSMGIVWEPYALYTQHQNGVSECIIQMILLIARNMLYNVQLDFNELWPEAVRTAVYVRHCSPTSTLPKLTPYEAWFREKPSLGHIHPFDYSTYSLVLQDIYKKFESKNKHCL